MDSRVLVIEGRRVRVFDRTPPIPESLQLMIEGGRDRAGRLWPPIRLSARRELRVLGARRQCLEQDHRMVPWLDGYHQGSDQVSRFLVLQACLDCGSVCVRDRSFDELELGGGMKLGRRPLRRKDHVIGWYSGSRRASRVYT